MQKHAIALVLLLIFHVPSWAQSAQPLTDADVQLAHMQAREWVGRGVTPQQSDYYGADRRVADVWAVRVALRDRGVLLGQGTAYAADFPTTAPPLLRLVENATEQAINATRQRLAERAARAIAEGADRQTAQPDWDAIGFRLGVQLEIAHSIEPIELLRTDRQARLLAAFVPGEHGLIFGEPTSDGGPTMLWPADAVAGNLNAQNLLTAGLARQGRDLTAMAELARPGGLPVHRVDVALAVDELAGMPAVQLQHGLRPLSADAISTQSVQAAADQLARHLAMRISTLRGTYKPSADQYEPIDRAALLNDQLVACLALVRMMDRQPDEARRLLSADDDNWVQQAVARFDSILELWQTHAELFDVQARSLFLLCLLDWPIEHPQFDRWRGALMQDLAHVARSQLMEPAAAGQPPAEPMDATTAALLAAALAQAYLEQPAEAEANPALGTTVGGVLDAVYLDLAQRPTLAALCWYVLAQDAAGRALVQRGVADADWRVQRDAAVAGMLDQLLTRQVLATVPDQRYRLGGIRLDDEAPAELPRENWQTAYVLLALSDALAARLSVDDAAMEQPARWLLAGQLAARFVMQLQFTEAEMFYVRNAAETRGGMRLSPGDNRLSIGPNAVTLLALERFLDAVDLLAHATR